jgi:hypothetical protein
MVMTDNQLKGNWAEQYIAARLAEKGCLIRHVPQGHDIGIDLYCETTEENTPFLHFWCQVKTSKNWTGKEKEISYPVEEKEKQYWLKQPVPVFVFLVPDLRDEYAGDFAPFYICRTDLLGHGKKLELLGKIESPNDLVHFLREELPYQYFLWELKEGKASYLKTVKNEYSRFFPSSIAQYFEDRLLESLRYTLWRLSHDIMFPNEESLNNFKKSIHDSREEERVKKAEPYVEAYRIIIGIQGYSADHYEVPCVLGLFSELKTEYETALGHYERSLSIIERDKKIDASKGVWKRIKEEIQEHIERVKTKISSNTS